MTAFSMEWAIAIFVRASVLLAAALVASWLFGRRRPSGVSAWHRVMLVGLLLLPCGVAFMPRLSVAWLPASATERISRTARILPPAIEPIKDLPAKEPAGDKGFSLNSPAQAATGSSAPVASADALPHVEARRQQVASEDRPSVSWATLLVMGIAAIYVSGIVFGLLRFAWGFYQAASLRRDCTAADAAWQAASAHWSQMLGIRGKVPVMVTDRLPVPATLGWLRPLILIPRRLNATDLVAQRDAVLLHELAHVARRDAFWQSVSHLTAVIYWCHPLMWLVGREVEAAWDAACDSVCAFYLGVGGYSRCLADLAQGLVARRLPLVGLCMARSSRLAGRIRRLKDAPNAGECRPRLTRRAMMWAVGLSAAFLAAVVTPVERSAAAQTPPAVAKETSKPAVVSGIVLDEDGSPIRDVKVLIRVSKDRNVRDPVHQTNCVPVRLREWNLVTGSDGVFQLEPGKRPDSEPMWARFTVTARGRREATLVLTWEDLARGKLAQFRLARGRVVSGRILAPDGRPVVGASIAVISTYRLRYEWESRFGKQGIGREMSYRPHAVKSDGKGRFEVTLPIQARGEILVDTPDCAPQRVAVKADATEAGDIKLSKGWRLSGKLLNRQGKPVAGQIVELESRDGGSIPNQFAPLTRLAKTDSQGRFELPPARGVFSVTLTPCSWGDSGGWPRLVADGPSVLLAPTVVQLDGSDPSPTIVLREPEAVTLSGRITWEDGRPAKNCMFFASVEAPPAAGSDKSSSGTSYSLTDVLCDEEGCYKLSVPRGLTICVSSCGRSGADHRFYEPWPQYTPRAAQLNMGSLTLKNVTEDIGNLDWVLKPDKDQPPVVAAPTTPAVVSGIVLDEDGSPLPDARLLIRVLDYRKLQDPHHQTCYIAKKLREWRLATGRDGSFKFEPGDRPNVEDPQIEAVIAARGRLEVRQLLDWKDLTNGKLAELRLTRGRVVAGRILAPDGCPVEGAAIHPTLQYPHRFDWEPEGEIQDADGKTRYVTYMARPVRSDAKGRFEVTLPVHAYAELRVVAPDWAPRRIGVQAEAAQVGDVKLTKGWSLSGRLLNKKGQPVAGQVVQLQGIDGGKISNYFAPLTRFDKTDSAGRFTLLPASGEFTLHVVPTTFFDNARDDSRLVADGPLLLLAPTVVHLDGSDPTPTIVLREPETVTLSGRVTWENGRAAEGSEFDAFGESSEPANDRPYYELGAGRSDKEGRYAVDVPRGATIHLSSCGRSGPDHRQYWPWPQYTSKAAQLNMGSLVLKNVTEDMGHLDWVLKPDKERPSRRRADSETPPPQPGDEVLAKLESEIAAVSKRGEDPRLTMLERCFEVEKENRGSRAAIGALHFVMRAGATTGEQSVVNGRERAARLLREHYLGHRDLDLLIHDFTAGYGGLAESEALLRAARKDSPYPHVRAAAGLYLAKLLQHRARMNEAFGKMDLAEYDKLKVGVPDEKGKEQTVEVRVADMPEASRKYFKEQRDQVAKLQKLLAHFDERANERAIVALLDDVIEHYAGVKGPRYRWDWSNYPRRDLRFIRPVPDDEPGNSPDYSAQAAKRKFQVTQLKLGHPAPDIVGKDTQGKPAKLSDDRGRVVVLTIGPDFRENNVALKRCHELLEKHGNARLSMVSVVEEEPNQPYSAYNKARGAGITWKVIADPDGIQCSRWCQITFPELYVIDAEGILRYHGMCGEYSEDFTPLVEELLKKVESGKRL